MAEFQRQIKHGNQTVDFYFKPIITPDATKYFVTAHNAAVVVGSFEMGKVMDKWVILKPAPEWSFSLEVQLSEIIAEAEGD